MLYHRLKPTGNAARPVDASDAHTHTALSRPIVGRASTTAAARCRWNAVSLAFLGDSVWEAVLRAHYYDPANMRQYGARVAASATTQAQAAVYQLLVGGSWLRAEEASLLRWASNSASVAPPPHASRQQYKQATAVEALVAHLYLTDAARLQQLMEWLLHPQRLKQWQQPLPAQAQQPASATRKSSAGRQAKGTTKPGSAATKGSQKGSSDHGSSAPGDVGTGAGGRRQPQQTGDFEQQQTSSSSHELDAGQEENSSDEEWRVRKVHRKAAEPPPKRPRLENDTTAKLRSSALDEQPGRADHGSGEDSCIEEGSDDEGEVVLERHVSEEQAAADLAAIRGMWELAAVYEFMSQFKFWLNFSQLYPLQDLEEALVRAPGPGLLAQLHVDLLQGIATRSHVGLDNWVTTLAARLASEAHAMQQPLTALPFRPVRGREAAEYAALGARQRVLTLKALADMRADREDMRGMMDDLLRAPPAAGAASGSNTPPRRSQRGASAPPPPKMTAEDLRGRSPLGCDAAGCRYYWFDMPYDHDAPVGLMGSRLYVEGPPREVTHEELRALQQQAQQDQKQQQDQKEQQQQQGGRADDKAVGKPPLPPTRSSGGGAQPSTSAVQDQPAVGSSRMGTPDAPDRQQQPEPAVKQEQQPDEADKKQTQAMNPPSISKLAEEAAAAAAAAAKPASSKPSKAKSAKAAGEAGAPAKPRKSLGAKYVLPPDAVAGSWRLAADSVEGLEALAGQLAGSSSSADVALGQLLLEQVVATLLERKEREEKFARARSRVAKSLGLDAPPELGRARRERKRTVAYSFDDYERKMKTAIRAQQARLDLEEPSGPSRAAYTAPPYDCEVRRGRSGGAAEPVLSLEEIEAQRKRRAELAKLGIFEEPEGATDGAAEAAADADAQQQQQQEGLAQQPGMEVPPAASYPWQQQYQQ
ncbi:hypothetical protein OEZ85_010121 [Tetradesmus obliquus]|uniref:DDT domain-containing protein n=1 Tax=Tetradesmus obliquus TaxID=3088 RepID=A0ABY8TLC3_TETOB|nr:hypothetical protein OEZ85_010121 [Tetradesmus obliquus]